MIDSIQSVCPACGNMFSVPKQTGGASMNCTNCGKPIVIVSHSSVGLVAVDYDKQPSQVTGSAKNSGGRERVSSGQFATDSGARQGVATNSSAWHLAVDVDPEAGMITQAWDAFIEKGWSCQDWPGVKAFAAVVKHPVIGGTGEEEINLTVSGQNGFLTLETVVTPLPPPPRTPVRELLNRINVRSGGSVFQIRECGIVARYKLFPRRIHRGVVSKDGVLRALTQLYRDLSNARPLLGPDAVHHGTPRAVEKAYAQPLAAQISSQKSTKDLQAMAIHVEYRAKAKGAMLYLARQDDPAGHFPVWLSVSRNVLRGWAMPGNKDQPAKRSTLMGFFSKAVGQPVAPKMSGPQFEALLENVDRLNESYGSIQYIWNGQQILGMAVFPPTEKRLEAQELRNLVDALFKCSDEVLTASDGSPLACAI